MRRNECPSLTKSNPIVFVNMNCYFFTWIHRNGIIRSFNFENFE